MIEFNGYAIFILCTLLAVYIMDLLSNLLNVSALHDELPDEFRDTLDAAEYARSQSYARTNTSFHLVSDTFSLGILLLFWQLGGFGWLDGLVRTCFQHPLWQGMAYVVVLVLGSYLLHLPFEIYHTFVIEERFGFNRTTPATFATDQFKSLCLMAVIGAPLLAGLLWFFEQYGANAWWMAWLTFTAVSLILSYVAPAWILPWFHRYEPLEDGELKVAIQKMAEQCKFPLREVYQIDGSRRSTKTNAFFVGFGRNKRIALYDTLIRNHTVAGLVAVLAHEIGHYRRYHILQRMAMGIVETGILFFLLGRWLGNQDLMNAFGVAEPSVYASLVFFAILLSPVRRIIAVADLLLSRRHEFEADAYAATVTGNPGDLAESLKRLASENLSNLTPHPLYVFWNYSHPPLTQRLSALRRVGT